MTNAIETAITALDTFALSSALDNALDFQTVMGDEDSVLIGDYMVWVDRQDANNVGWCWRRAFIGGAPTTGEDDTFDTAAELLALIRGAGYEVSA